jgi:hypothetical protein
LQKLWVFAARKNFLILLFFMFLLKIYCGADIVFFKLTYWNYPYIIVCSDKRGDFMTPSLDRIFISSLRDSYFAEKKYSEEGLKISQSELIVNTEFIGSLNFVFLKSGDFIAHEAPACIAAPSVTMIAQKAISLGSIGQGSYSVPVCLYASRELTIKTQMLSIGDLNILAEPEDVTVFCKKLVLSESMKKKAPDQFEIVKSWIDDENKIEIV